MPKRKNHKIRMSSNADSVSVRNEKQKRARSAWAAQHRKVKMGIRSEFVEKTKNPKLNDLVKFSLKGPGGASQKERIDFLRKHKNVLKRVLKREVGKVGKHEYMLNADEIVREIEISKDIPEGMVDSLISKVIDDVLQKELNLHGKKLEKGLKKYLKQRKIPFDKEILEHVTSISIATKELNALGAGINLAKFERNYIVSLRNKRAFDLESARFNNLITRKALRGVKITPNQMRSMKRWLRIRREALAKEFKAQIKKPRITFDEIERLADLQINQLSSEMRVEFVQRFGQEKRVKEIAVENLKAALKTSGTRKQGTRAERLAAYTPKERVEVREEIIQKKEHAAKIAGKKFDPAKFAISEIRRKNPETADLLNGMFKRKVLSRGSVRKLYESGSLSQRVFVSAVIEHGFIRAFGEKQVNALARGISHIGAVGKKIPVAKKAFQSAESSGLFKFLKKANLIETHHGGGHVVYLHRPQSHYGGL